MAERVSARVGALNALQITHRGETQRGDGTLRRWEVSSAAYHRPPGVPALLVPSAPPPPPVESCSTSFAGKGDFFTSS